MARLLHIRQRYKKQIFIIGYLIPIIYAIITLLLKFWQTNKGLIMSDEAWYLFLLKDQPRSIGTNFYTYFQNIFQGNIYAIRITAIFLNLLGSTVYSLGLYLFFKNRLRLSIKEFYLIWSFASLALFGGIFLTWICYFTLNQLVLFLSTGLILIGIQSKNRWISGTVFLLSGLFLGTLFFIMISNIPIILLTLIWVYFMSHSRWGNISLISFGVILSVILFFLFFDHFSQYYDEITSNITDAVAGSGKHSLTGLLDWIKKTLIYLAFNILTGAIFLYVFIVFLLNKDPRFNSSKVKMILSIILASSFFIGMRSTFISEPYGFPSTTPFLVSYGCLLLFQLIDTQSAQYKENILFIFVFSIPVFLSLGTDVRFKFRAILYIPFLIPVIYLLILHRKQFVYRFYFVFLILISAYFINHVRLYFTDNHFNMNYSKQVNSLSSIHINQKIRLDQEKFDILQQIKKEIHPGDNIAIDDYSLWGYAYLLDTRPVSYDFWANEDLFMKQLKKKPIAPITLKLLSINELNLKEKFLNDIKTEIHADTIIRKKMGPIIIYSFR